MNRALLVIDVQNEYISGNLPIGFPHPDVSLSNIGKAIDAATEAGIPVIAVQQAAPETSPIFARGSHGFDLHPVVGSRGHDHLVEKTLPSCFTGTDLAEWLTAHDVDTVAISGYMTQNCDESTARDAAHRGLKVEFLADATGTLAMSNEAGSLGAEQLHTAVLVVLQSRFASVVSTAEWIDAVQHGSPVPKPDIFRSTQAGRDAAADLV
ncbi:cysteine hydrolase family protein [Arthrobacter sp. NPDC058192]|uniref:cysteine hydrolase family protein n=1 Tax=Arthrobacter sp. NPDC058192 TaxID=3346372 RepID=UPI0036E95CCC